MLLKYIIVCMAFWSICVATPTPAPNEEEKKDPDEKTDPEDNVASESQFITNIAGFLPSPAPVTVGETLSELNSFPYEAHIATSYGAPPVPQPSYGISLNTNAILAPKVEALRLIEAFITVKGEVLTRFNALLNDNWELIRTLINFITGKLQKLQSIALKIVLVLRTIAEFALNLFSNFSITLPSLTFGSEEIAVGTPHSTYGIPLAAPFNFLRGWMGMMGNSS